MKLCKGCAASSSTRNARYTASQKTMMDKSPKTKTELDALVLAELRAGVAAVRQRCARHGRPVLSCQFRPGHSEREEVAPCHIVSRLHSDLISPGERFLKRKHNLRSSLYGADEATGHQNHNHGPRAGEPCPCTGHAAQAGGRWPIPPPGGSANESLVCDLGSCRKSGTGDQERASDPSGRGV